ARAAPGRGTQRSRDRRPDRAHAGLGPRQSPPRVRAPAGAHGRRLVSDRYLWDKSGPPDAEVERIETQLPGFAPRGAPLELSRESPRLRARARPRWTWALAAAAALVMVAGIAWCLSLSRRGWEVAARAGAPRVAERTLAGSGRVAAG